MEYEKSANKSKIIVGCVIIAAVAILYFVSAHKSTSAQVSSTTGTTDTSTTATTPDTTSSDTSTSTSTSTSSGTGSYKDGTYTSNITYNVPHSNETLGVTVTISGGVVTSSSVAVSDYERESAEYQDEFASSYKSYVDGKNLSDISLSRISGASLTTDAFNSALEQIKTQATA